MSSVVEKPVTERAPRSPQKQLAVSSLLGAVYVLVSLWAFFVGAPLFWNEVVAIRNPFLSGALLIFFNALVGLGLWYLGRRFEKANYQHGLRAGMFVGAFFFYLVAWLTVSVIGNFLAERDLGWVGLILTLAAGAGLAFLIVRMYFKPGFGEWLKRVEDQGWFHALPYKPTQGVKVRRGTVLGILVVGIAGIITLVQQGSLGREAVDINNQVVPNNWTWAIPNQFVELFVSDVDPTLEFYFPLMFKVHVVLPMVLCGLLVWFAWRVVNFPAFADFLIATEAEMNKVSWTTRRRLVQDTIVVLVTVFVLTAFLFIVDIIWINVLSWPPIGVLQVDIRGEQVKQQEKTQW